MFRDLGWRDLGGFTYTLNLSYRGLGSKLRRKVLGLRRLTGLRGSRGESLPSSPQGQKIYPMYECLDLRGSLVLASSTAQRS